MNLVVMVGRLATAPEIRTTTTGISVTHFRVAVNRRYKAEGQPEADFFNCVCFGKTAELISQYFYKGKQIAFEGRLQNNNWTDQQGIKRYNNDIIISSFDFIGKKEDNASIPAQDSDFTKEDYEKIFGDIDEEPPF